MLTTLGTTTGNIVLNGTTTFNAGAGGLTIMANETYSNAGTINYSSSYPLSITSSLTASSQTRTLTVATSAALNLTATTGTININNQVANRHSYRLRYLFRDAFHRHRGTRCFLTAWFGGGDVTIDITGAGNVELLGGGAIGAFAQIGYDTGNVASNLTHADRRRSPHNGRRAPDFCYALIGHGSQIAGAGGGTRTGNITFGNALNPIPGSVTLIGTAPVLGIAGVNSFAQIGHTRSPDTSPAIVTGDIDLRFVTGAITENSGSLSNTYTLIGHGGPASSQPDSYTGDVQVQTSAATSFISLQSGTAAGAFSGIGHIAYMNGAGTVTIQSNALGANTISAIAGSYIILSAQAGAEAVIGGYVNASSGSGAISIGTVNIETQNGNDLAMTGPVANTAFNGTLIGALAYTGAIPIVSAGSAGTNTTLTIDGNLAMQSGSDGTTDQTFCLIQNGSGSPAGGPFTTTIGVNGNASINGAKNITAVTSLNDLTFNVGGVLNLTADFSAGSSGSARVVSGGETTVTADYLSLTGFAGGPAAEIVNSAEDLSITANNNIELFDNADINLSGGSGTLTVMTTSGAMLLDDNCFIQNAGTGPTIVNSFVDIIINVGVVGPAFISCLGPLDLTYGGDLSLAAAATGNASILSAGTTSITGGEHLAMRGALPANTALIQNTTGDLSITSKAITLQDKSVINLSGGSGTLSVTATTEDLLLMHSSSIQNLGTGSTMISTDDDIQLHGDTGSGAALILTNGPTVINAGQMILMTGGPGAAASIRGNQGNFSVSAGSFLQCVQYSDITLLGGSGTLEISIGDDGLVQNTSVLQSLGSGPFNVTAGGSLTLIGGLGNGSIIGNTGDLTIDITNNLNLSSNPNGSATVQSGGNLAINAGQSVNMGGLGSGEQSLVQTTAGDLTVIANVNIAIHDNAAAVNAGTGNLTLVVDQQAPASIGTGRFILDPGASLSTTGGGLALIFTAMPSGYSAGSNLAFGTVNGNPVVTGLCPFELPAASATDQYNTFFDTFAGGGGVPYTLFYKLAGPTPPPPPPAPPTPFVPSHAFLQHKLSTVVYASSELFFIVRDYTRYYWNPPFLVCCGDALEKKKTRKLLFECDLFSPGAYPVLHQNWTKYPVYYPEASSCSDLDSF